MRTHVGLLGAIAFAAPALAPAAPSHPDPTLAFYPQAALAAGVGGTATVTCAGRGANGGCRVTRVAPAGDGFGEAAIRFVSTAYAKCVGSLYGREFKLTFIPKPPNIEPDLFGPGPQNAHWIQRPTGEDMAKAYPRAAVRSQASADTVMTCVVNGRGGLSECKVVEENPPGFHFDAADLELVPLFRMALTSCSGEPVAGRTIIIPIRWRIP